MRALHQMVAYEIPMLLSVVGVVVLSGSLDLVKIVYAQSSIWFILLQPLGAITFYICVLAELERIPFDLPEADSELVAGWQTEYGGDELRHLPARDLHQVLRARRRLHDLLPRRLVRAPPPSRRPSGSS